MEDWFIVLRAPHNFFISLNWGNIWERTQKSPDSIMNKNSPFWFQNMSIDLLIKIIWLTWIFDGWWFLSKSLKKRLGHINHRHSTLKRWRCFSWRNCGGIFAWNIYQYLAFLTQGRLISHRFFTPGVSISQCIATRKTTLKWNFLKQFADITY